MSNRRETALAVLAVCLVSVAMRLLPLHWTPLPYNVDGFHFTALARMTSATGDFAATGPHLNPDEYVFTAYLTAVSQVTGVEPLAIAQFLVAIVGTVPALAAMVFVYHICDQLGWRRSHTRVAAVLAGLILAVEGVYLGRSAAVSSEMLGHAFVVLLALSFYRALRTERPAWMALTVAFVVALPLTHNLGSMVAALVLFAIFVRSLGTAATRRRVVFGSTVLLFFWGFMLYYYQTAGLAEASYITALPGLFLAWVILLATLALWLPSAGSVVQRLIPVCVVGGVVGLLVANHFYPIFPGTASTALLQLAFLLPVALVGLVAAWGLPKLSRDHGLSVVIVGLLSGPLALIGFSMTGNLTHEYEALAVRGQIFGHFALGVLAAIAAVDIGYRYRSSQSVVRRSVVPLVILCVVVSAPFAFAGLHATSAQPTVTPSELSTGSFASNHIDDSWLGDGHIVIMSSRYYPNRTSARYTPLYQWLQQGGSAPNCAIVAQRSWTTVGAQMFPSSPVSVTTDRYDRWTAHRDVVYSASGRDPLVVTMPRGSNNCPVEQGDIPTTEQGSTQITNKPSRAINGADSGTFSNHCFIENRLLATETTWLRQHSVVSRRGHQAKHAISNQRCKISPSKFSLRHSSAAS